MYTRVPAFFRNLAALQHMNWYCRLITNLKYLCKILIHYDPQASWIYFINVLLCSDFSRLVGNGGSIFYRDIRDLWSVYNTNLCTEVPQDSKKNAGTQVHTSPHQIGQGVGYTQHLGPFKGGGFPSTFGPPKSLEGGPRCWVPKKFFARFAREIFFFIGVGNCWPFT